ncbi:hypothetical protein NUU61_005428 [Penicillium alfredii]|uniref:Uncharacterized protein n=1 Tax=Penicillium alfredii TaxID=1506179 RepID=A0A9W9F9F8_9EURO|nr:uncharacterized protein NUU61_005428 [Penicillium alfredii]KAJ5096072.1 hypothetical protein NUU61_005428 [Penicillium alfredii]
MPSRSASPFRSTDLQSGLEVESDDQKQNRQPKNKPDHSRITTRGAPARHSRRERSEYRSWDRASDKSSVGRTGSKYRSQSRH